VFTILCQVPQLANMANSVRNLIWRSSTIEEYRSGALINNGKRAEDFDFLLVIQGSILFRLQKLKVQGAVCHSFPQYIEVLKGGLADTKFITDKRFRDAFAQVLSEEPKRGNSFLLKAFDEKLCNSTESARSAKKLRTPNPFLGHTIDEVKAWGRANEKTIILRIPNCEYKAFVEDILYNEHSMWTKKGLETYVFNNFPEIKEISSIKVRQQVKSLALVEFLPPNTVVAREGEVMDQIKLVVGGRIDCYQKIKESFE